ncbi:MAG: hypothetical protein ABS951_10955, partial [Solibacillus sp.]
MKKIISWFVVLMLVVNTITPATVFSATTTPAKPNEEILAFLEEEYGAEQADAAYSTLQKLGVLDGSGGIVQMPVHFNGETYTIDELQPILNDPATDLSQMAEVDGQPISLESIKKIIDIETEIEETAAYQDTSNVEITEEHLTKLESLVEQASKEGLQTTEAPASAINANTLMATNEEKKDPRGKYEIPLDGYDDEIVVSVTDAKTWPTRTVTKSLDKYFYPHTSDDTKTEITFELNKPVEKEVSFAYEFIGGAYGAYVTLELKDPEIPFSYNKIVSKELMQMPEKSGLGDILTDTASDNRITFQPNQTSVTYTVSIDMLKLGYSTGMLTYLPQNREAKYKDSILQRLWTNYAKGDYLHFYDYKNLDSIRFDARKLYEKAWADHYRNMHTYEGGAYLTFTAFKNTSAQFESGSVGNKFGKWTPGHFVQENFYTRETEPGIDGVYAKPGTYKTGQLIPIVVEYNKPMAAGWLNDYTYLSQPNQYMAIFKNSSHLTLANGEVAVPELLGSYALDRSFMPAYQQESMKLKLGQASISTILGYSAVVEKETDMTDYEVKSARNMTDGYAFEYSRENIVSHQRISEHTKNSIEWKQGFTNEPEIEIVPNRADAFTSISVDQDVYRVGDTLKVTVEVDHDKDKASPANWILDGGTTIEDLKTRILVSIGDRENGVIQNLDWKRNPDGSEVLPLTLEGSIKLTQKMVSYISQEHENTGNLRAKIYYLQEGTGTDTSLSRFVMYLDKKAEFVLKDVSYIYPEDLTIHYPSTWLSGKENTITMEDQEETQLTFTYPEQATFVTEDQFEWTSNNPAIADILQDGTIVPKAEGKVSFKLTAKNNDTLEPETFVMSKTMEIFTTDVPFLRVPKSLKLIRTAQSEDTTITWSSNMQQVLKKLAEESGQAIKQADFKVELFEGIHTLASLKEETPIKAWEAPAASTLVNASSFVIPGSNLTKVSERDIPTYTAKISIENPTSADLQLVDVVQLVVKRAPTKVAFEGETIQFLKDDVGTLNVPFTLKNFEGKSSSEFSIEVIRQEEGKNPVTVQTAKYDPETKKFTPQGITATGGTLKVNVEPVANNSRAKYIYLIRAKAKNDGDDAWSQDSMYIHVYRTDAFAIQVDEQAKQAHTLTNIDEISQMNSGQIVNLNRQIFLKNQLNINYKDYNELGTLLDQFAWKSSNPIAADVYYRSNEVIDSVDNFSNKSYQARTQFTLVGEVDGQTTIKATHMNTGIEATLDLTVETLQDKLYLFQFYPKTQTEITYTNGDNVERVAHSDANGALAIYEEKGIKSDVYVKSQFNNSVYTGVINQESLKTKERNAVKKELYPLNSLQLRQLAKVEVFYKKPDGTPYTGDVTYFAGVYKNDAYAEPTEIGGTGVTKTLGSDGRLEIIFDTTDFYSSELGETNASTLSAKDKLQFIVETHFADNKYYPQIYRVSGDTKPVDMVAVGSKISMLKANESAEKTPFLVNQFYQSTNAAGAFDLTRYADEFGIRKSMPSIEIISEMMWWGKNVDKAAQVKLLDNVGTFPKGQSYVTKQYPFSQYYTTTHRQLINRETIWLNNTEKGPLTFNLYEQPDTFTKNVTSEARLINMIDEDEVTAAELKNKLREMKNELTSTNTNFSGPSNNDRVVLETLQLLGNLNVNAGPMSMSVIPTDNPSVYRTLVKVNVGSFPKTDQEGLDTQLFQKKSANFNPGPDDVEDLLFSNYVEDKRAAISQNKDGHSNSGEDFGFAGFYLGEIIFNEETGRWENVLLTGRVRAGAGFSYSQSMNVQVGPIPATFSIGIGGGGDIEFATNAAYQANASQAWTDPTLQRANDYLTSLRLYAYIEAFGGVGFDYSIIAAKIGVFGRISMDNTSKWLNQQYFATASQRNKFGNQLTLSGVTGIRATLKFLFVSITHDFASLRYTHSWRMKHWNAIEKYWKENSHEALTSANMEEATLAYMRSIGVEPMEVIESQTVESRDYLDAYKREWHAAGQSLPLLNERLAMQTVTLSTAANQATVLQSNAYPYSNPDVSNDGSLAVYLSDSNSANIQDTVASWMKQENGQYVDKGPIVKSKGYGDSNLTISGETGFMVATWIRQTKDIVKGSGESLTNEEIVEMNNSAEIMAAVYNGATWKEIQLTNNETPDVAPVVAVNSRGEAIVVYRNVLTNESDPFTFERDYIVYRAYNETDGWGEEQVLYNGEHGTVTGLKVALSAFSKAGILYSVKAPSSDNNKMVFETIDIVKDPDQNLANGWLTKGSTNYIQLADENELNENPQLTIMRIDGSERFIIGWYNEKLNASGAVTGDIRFEALDRDGNIKNDFVGSLAEVKGANDVKINPNFSFVKTSMFSSKTNIYNKIDHFSILWKEAQTDVSGVTTTVRDALYAVQFGADESGVFMSGALPVGVMPAYTMADQYSAYLKSGSTKNVTALVLGTTYTTDAQTVGTMQSSGTGEEIPINISKTVSGMYMLDAYYENKITLEDVIYNPSEIIPTFDLPVQFEVVNQGMLPIKTVEIKIAGNSKLYNNLTQKPNELERYLATYTVPEKIANVPYQVIVTFSDNSIKTEVGTLELDIPDVGVSPVILTKEQDALREIAIPIFNQSHATLIGKGHTIKYGVYTNTTFDEANLLGSVQSISNDDAFRLMEMGGFTTSHTIDINALLSRNGDTEIPKQGYPLFIHAWVEDSTGQKVTEFNSINNMVSYTVENLAEKYDAAPVFISTELTKAAATTASTANIEVQSTQMEPITSGNVVVNLLDENRNVLETKYIATDAAQLLSFAAEEIKKFTVAFSQGGHSVEARFFIENASDLSNTLDGLTFEGVGIPFDSANYTYTADVQDLKETKVLAVASNRHSKLTLLDEDNNVLSIGTGVLSNRQLLDKTPEGTENIFKIKVTPVASGGTESTYTFTIRNTGTSNPQFNLVLDGTLEENGVYSSDVQVSMAPYMLQDFNISEALIRVNENSWQAVAYDGSQQVPLTTLTTEDTFTIEVKVALLSGLEYQLPKEQVTLKRLPLADAPVGIRAVNESVIGAADGQIEGVQVGQEYRLIDTTNWLPVLSNPIQNLAPATYEIRVMETQTHQASSIVKVTIQEGPLAAGLAAPTNITTVPETFKGRQDGKIIGLKIGQEYRLISDTEWITVITEEDVVVPPGDYEVRYMETRSHLASNPTSVRVDEGGRMNGLKAPSMITVINESNRLAKDGKLLGVTEEQEYKMVDSMTWIPITDNTISNLAPGIYEVRFAENAYYEASAIAQYTVKEGPRASRMSPTGIVGESAPNKLVKYGKITGVTSEMEYVSPFDTTYNWKPIEGTELNNLLPGRYSIRFAQTDTHLSSPQVDVYIVESTVKAPGPGPLELTAKNETIKGANDGAIIGAGFGTEHRLVGTTSWIAYSVEARWLAPGDYEVRTAETDVQLAGEIAKVTILPGGLAKWPYPPTGIKAEAETKPNQADGKILGVQVGQEYSVRGTNNWIPITSEEVTGLAPGQYEVRFAETSTHLPSDPAWVTVAPGKLKLSNIRAVNETVYGANDGKITGVEFGQSYKKAYTTTWIAVKENQTEITGLSSGEYSVAILDGNENLIESLDENNNSIYIKNVKIGFDQKMPGQAIPAGIQAIAESVKGANDGQIDITSARFPVELRLKGTTHWSATSYFLQPGIYEVRYSENNLYEAGPVTELTVEEGPLASGPVAPTGITAEPESVKGAKDGKLKGVTASQEYRLVGETTWTKVTGAEITGLAPGNYEIREAETATHEAGAIATVTVMEGLPSPLQPGPSAPTGITAEDESVRGANDGKLTGVTPSQEYRLVGSILWVPITGSEITNLAPSKYEVREMATATHLAGVTVEVTIASGPLAPGSSAPTGITAEPESVKGAKDGKLIGVTASQEYRLVGETTWTKVTGAEVTGLAPGDYEVREAETATYEASAIAIVTVMEGLPSALQPGPAAPVGIAAEAESVKGAKDGKLKGITASQEYRLVGEATWTKVTGAEVTGLAPGDYEIREAETATHEAGAIAIVTIMEGLPSPLQPGPAAPIGIAAEAESVKGANDGKLIGVTPSQEYRQEGSILWVPITGSEVTDLAPGKYEVREKATATHLAGAIVTVTIMEGLPSPLQPGPAAPTGIAAEPESIKGAKDGKLIGVTASQEYRLVGETTWTKVTGAEVTGLAPGDYEIREAETATHEAGAIAIVTIMEGLPSPLQPGPAAPIGIAAEPESVKGANDGKLIGVTVSQEYRQEDSILWVPMTGSEVTGLAPGKYEVREMATATHLAGAITELVIEEGPLASGPSAPTGIIVVAESVEGSKDGKLIGVTSSQEYRLVGETTWTTITGVEVANLAPGDYEVREAETATHEAGEIATVTVIEGLPSTLQPGPAAPTGITAEPESIGGANDGKLIGVTPSQEYRQEGSILWIPITGSEVTGLTPGKYEVREMATATHLAGTVVELVIEEGPLAAGPSAPVGITAEPESVEGAKDGKLKGVTASQEYRLAGESTWTKVTGAEVTGLAPGDYEVREAETATHEAGEIATVTVEEGNQASLQPGPSAPTDITSEAESVKGAKDGKLIGVTASQEYRLAGESTWTKVTGAEVTGLAPGDYEVREAETATHEAGEIATVTVEEGNQASLQPGPSAPTDITSEAESVKGAKDGKLIGVTASQEYRLAGESTWTKVTGAEVTGLAPGDYEVREAETATHEAGATATVTVEEGNPAPLQPGPAAPTGITAEAESVKGAKDGKLKGVKASQEYRLVGEATWTKVTGAEVTGLAPGDY